MTDLSNEPLLRCKGLEKTFQKEKVPVHALRGVDLSVDYGESLGIMGASGSGKSTLLHLLGTLARPSGGEIFFEGKNVTGWNDRDLANFRNKELGFVFQFHYLLSEFNALENVMMPALLRGDPAGSETEEKEKALELLKRVGLENRLKHRPGELSGGEQQRVALARALMNRPKLLLADEPTGNLDSENEEKVTRLLQEIHQEYGMTMIMVTHDHQLASKMKRCVTMEDGLLLGSS
jgi:lipoprotein-releasing system ATP-binding protein